MKNMTRYALLIISLCAVFGCASPDKSASPYRNIPVTAMFASQFKPVRIDVSIPESFVIAPLPNCFGRYICASSSVVSNIPPESSGAFPDPASSGYFGATLSMVYGYDRKQDIFTDFKKNTEKTLAAGLQAQGATQVVVKRVETAGYPVLLLDMVMPDGTHFCNVFIALKVETNVLSIRYFPSKAWSERDATQWKTFIAAFGEGKKEKSNKNLEASG